MMELLSCIHTATKHQHNFNSVIHGRDKGPFFWLRNILWINPPPPSPPFQQCPRMASLLINRLRNKNCTASLAYIYIYNVDTENGTNNLNGWSGPILKFKIMTTDTITYMNYYSSKRLNFLVHEKNTYKKKFCKILCEAVQWVPLATDGGQT